MISHLTAEEYLLCAVDGPHLNGENGLLSKDVGGCEPIGTVDRRIRRRSGAESATDEGYTLLTRRSLFFASIHQVLIESEERICTSCGSNRMASSCIRQMASLSLRTTTRVLAAPRNLKVVGLSSPSFTHDVRPWFRQACEPLRASSFQLAALPRPMLTGDRGRFSVFSQAVTTTPETEAEAETVAEPTIPETTDEAPPPTLKTKKLTKRVKHIMEILDKEAVEAANKVKDIPDIRPGDVIQLRVEVPENKRRVSLLRGIVIARRNAGINTTFRIRRVIAGVGVEMVFPLYSPNIKEIKVVDKRKVRRAKLFYLRDKIARMSSC